MAVQDTTKVCLIGAGFISSSHAAAISLIDNIEVVAIVDPNISAAKQLASSFQINNVFATIAECLDQIEFDSAHVLVPPNLHFSVIKELLEASKNVFAEKPITERVNEANELIALADEKGVTLAVNQNAIYQPAFMKAIEIIKSNKLGPLQSVYCRYEMPLRQLDAGLLGHWMFREPINILLEQAVHPLSQLVKLIGKPQEMTMSCAPAKEIAPGLHLFQRVDIQGKGNVPFQMGFKVGQDFPIWEFTLVCEDGVIQIDLARNTITSKSLTKFLPALDGMLNSTKDGLSLIGQGVSELFYYATSLLKLTKPRDVFSASIRNSIEEFYKSLNKNEKPFLSGEYGRDLVAICEEIESELFSEIKNTPVIIPETKQYDVLVLGGTGFIGKALLPKLLEQGHKVGIMARNVATLPELFYQENVSLIKASVTNKEAVNEAISHAKYVINLAHGGASGSFEAIRDAMVGSATLVANSCLEHNVERLIHVGSIASLFLGDANKTIYCNEPSDPQPEKRAEYSRAKVLADEALLAQHKKNNLPLVILRPGVVVGKGGMINHTGIGFFNNTQHFIGWNNGNNSLPFVLVNDTADAIVNALTADNIIGKSLNIVGEVDIGAAEYIKELRERSNRPYQYHGQATRWLHTQEIGKWAIKKLAGSKAPAPSIRDLNSRAMISPFDISEEKALLNWAPESNKAEFLKKALDVHFENE